MKKIIHLMVVLTMIMTLTDMFAAKATLAQSKIDSIAKKEFLNAMVLNAQNKADLQYIKLTDHANDKSDTSRTIYKFNLYKQGCNYPAIRLSNLTSLAKIKLKVNGKDYVMSAKDPSTYFVVPISKNSDTVNIYLIERDVHQLEVIEQKEQKAFIGIGANYLIDSLIPTEYKLAFKNKEVSAQNIMDVLIPMVTKKNDTLLTSTKTLNTLFANLISPFLSQATDLSASKAYIVMDNVNNYLFLGGSIKVSKRTAKHNQFLITPGIKINTKDGLAAILDNKKFNSDFGFSIKLTLFGNGSVYYNTPGNSDNQLNATILDKKQRILNYRKSLADELLNKLDGEYSKQKSLLKGLKDSAVKLATIMKTKNEDLAADFASQEATFLLDNQLFNIAHTHWTTMDLYVPFKNDIAGKIATDLKALKYPEVDYYPTSISFTHNQLVKVFRSNFAILPHGSYNLTLKGSFMANNSINAHLLGESQQLIRSVFWGQAQDTVNSRVIKTNDVYIGKYETFWTPALSSRFVYMTNWNQSIGLSFSAEKSFGQASAMNWKIGVPAALKDKDGKSKINFELLWKEVYGRHTLGISLALPIGDNIF